MLARPGARPGLRHATASGVASGVASALTQTVTVAATDRSEPTLGAHVVLVALLVAAFAAGGLLLSQTAYRGGLGAPLAVVTLANPVAAAAIGVTLLGDRLRGGLEGLPAGALGALLAAWGVVVLSRAARVVGAVPVPAVAAVPEGAALPDVVTVPEEHPVAAVLALDPESCPTEAPPERPSPPVSLPSPRGSTVPLR
ncbi:hypothetical protein B0E37_04793 [Streptomyces sp. MH192]|nr:hypothetical protein [Streptomyces sp. MH192]MCF0101809.1 hypothetical protein [Streptomyces sp. MH191]